MSFSSGVFQAHWPDRFLKRKYIIELFQMEVNFYFTAGKSYFINNIWRLDNIPIGGEDYFSPVLQVHPQKILPKISRTHTK